MDLPRQSTYARRLRFEPLELRRVLSITVDTLIDENNGVGTGAGTSLREAIAAAVAGDTIDFSVTGTINLSVGTTNSTKQLTINKNLTISGPGANLLKIKAYDPTPTLKNGDGSRIFNIDDGNEENLLDDSISGLTLTGGDVSEEAGAILNRENLTVNDCTIKGNATTVGGFRGGGGIYSNAGFHVLNSLTIRGSTISGNSSGAGGGVFGYYTVTTIERSTISDNVAHYGGGVFGKQGGNMTVSGSTISGNQSSIKGGGIESVGTPLNVTNSTISGNTSTGGGGISCYYTTATINNSTISGNNVTSYGGGIDTGSIGSAALNHAIVAGNLRGGNRDDIAGVVSARFSLIGDNTGATVTGNVGSLIGTGAAPINPLLGALADNGGPTKTRALQTGSPAIDAGDPAAVAGMGGVPLYDQRGTPYARVFDGDGTGAGRIDIGAVELQSRPLPAAVFGDYDGGGMVNASDYVLWRKTVSATVGPYGGADGSGNGVVGAEDYDVWREHFGETIAAGSGAGAEMRLARSESSAGGVDEVATVTPFAESRGVPPGGADVMSEAQADVGHTLQIASLAGAPFGTAGQASSGTRMWALATPLAPEVLLDDALVAWVESAGSVRESATIEFDAISRDSIEISGDDSCDALDAAVGELMTAALL